MPINLLDLVSERLAPPILLVHLVNPTQVPVHLVNRTNQLQVHLVQTRTLQRELALDLEPLDNRTRTNRQQIVRLFHFL
jgi:hypothetical protein